LSCCTCTQLDHAPRHTTLSTHTPQARSTHSTNRQRKHIIGTSGGRIGVDRGWSSVTYPAAGLGTPAPAGWALALLTGLRGLTGLATAPPVRTPRYSTENSSGLFHDPLAVGTTELVFGPANAALSYTTSSTPCPSSVVCSGSGSGSGADWEVEVGGTRSVVLRLLDWCWRWVPGSAVAIAHAAVLTITANLRAVQPRIVRSAQSMRSVRVTGGG
jgi:hypothetical protein